MKQVVWIRSELVWSSLKLWLDYFYFVKFLFPPIHPTPTLRSLLPALCISTHSHIKWLWLVCLPHFWSITSDINNVPPDKTFACLMRLEAERADQSHYSLLHGSDSCGEDINQETDRDWCSYHFSIIKIKE